MASSLWKARLLPASFRGIPFFVDEHEYTGGRNLIQHEPPEKDSGFTEDLGRTTPVFVIEGHVLGDNYFFIRDALINAMEDGESGILVHPYLGVKEVQPGKFSFKESTKDGRVCAFNLQFSLAGTQSFPIALLDSVTDFLTSVVATVAIVKNAFQLAYSISLLPGFARESAQAIAADFTDSVRSSIAGISGDEADNAELKKALEDFDSNTEAMVANPASFAQEIDSIMELVRDLPPSNTERTTIDIVSGRDERLDALSALAAFSSVNAEIAETTPTRTREKQNADAICNLIKQLAALRLAENAIEKEFDSLESAIAVRETISELLEDQLKQDIDDELFKYLSQFKSKVVAAIPTGNLATVESIDVMQSVPSIVLAYDLYESEDNELDIIERNRIKNPCFVSGTLEVLRLG